MKNVLIGNKQFYKKTLKIMIPIAVQNAITNFVGLLDNIMIGQLGTLAMTGVSITNQLLMIFNLAVFGALSCPGIYNAQFYGKKDKKGVQDCFHYKLFAGGIILLVGFLIFIPFKNNLILLYLTTQSNSLSKISVTLNHAAQYLNIMLIGLPPFVLSQIYSTSLRETEDTVLPMISSLFALSLNFILNYVLIFGHFSFPKLGIVGGALATVIARYVEFIILFIGTHFIKKNKYFKSLYSHFRIPLDLVKTITIKGFPLLINEILWSSSIAIILQCYSVRGIDVIAAMNINTTVNQTFMIVCYAMGNAISIMVGNELGAGEIKKAYYTDLRLIFFNFIICIITGCLLYISSPFIPIVYNTNSHVMSLATSLLKITALLTPIVSLYYSSYFTLRAGGKTLLTFAFDSLYSITVSLSIAFCLIHFTQMDIINIYLCVQSADIIKAILGIYLVKKGIWLNNIVHNY